MLDPGADDRVIPLPVTHSHGDERAPRTTGLAWAHARGMVWARTVLAGGLILEGSGNRSSEFQ